VCLFTLVMVEVIFTCRALASYLRVGQNLRMDPKVCNNLYGLEVERKDCCKSMFFLIFYSLIDLLSCLPRLDNLNANWIYNFKKFKESTNYHPCKELQFFLAQLISRPPYIYEHHSLELRRDVTPTTYEWEGPYTSKHMVL
jgi:hypothetical protein